MAQKISTLGLGGMDALSFFESSKPRCGSFDFKTQVGGMTYCAWRRGRPGPSAALVAAPARISR